MKSDFMCKADVEVAAFAAHYAEKRLGGEAAKRVILISGKTVNILI